MTQITAWKAIYIVVMDNDPRLCLAPFDVRENAERFVEDFLRNSGHSLPGMVWEHEDGVSRLCVDQDYFGPRFLIYERLMRVTPIASNITIDGNPLAGHIGGGILGQRGWLT